jgi:hypothetical protein
MKNVAKILAMNKKQIWIGRFLSTVVSLFMTFTVVMKIKMSGTPQLAEGFAHVGIPMAMLKTIIILEAVSIILYMIPATAVLGAIMLTGYMGGTICTHLRIGENVAMQTAIPIVAWLGLYLRDSRLHQVLPLRRS